MLLGKSNIAHTFIPGKYYSGNKQTIYIACLRLILKVLHLYEQISVLRLALPGVFEEQKLQADSKLRVQEASYYSFSSAFAIPALSCYILIVTAAIVGI